MTREGIFNCVLFLLQLSCDNNMLLLDETKYKINFE